MSIIKITALFFQKQEQVLSELYRYITENPQEDTDATRKTLSYLEACNKLFEKGFLSHNRIMDVNSEVLQSINEGYRFFTTWMNQILEKGICTNKHLDISSVQILLLSIYGLLQLREVSYLGRVSLYTCDRY